MASIFDDDDAKTSATSLLAAKPAAAGREAGEAGAGASQPVASVTHSAPMAAATAAETFTETKVAEPTVSKAAEAPETSVKSTAAGRLAALRQRISSGSSGSDSDAAWEPEPKPKTKPAASASLFGAAGPAGPAGPAAVSDFFGEPVGGPGPLPEPSKDFEGFPSAAPRDSEQEFAAPKEDVQGERAEPVQQAAMSLPEPTPGLPAASERPSLFGGTKGPSGRTMNSIFDDDDDDDFLKPGPLAKGPGPSGPSSAPRSTLSSLFGEPGPGPAPPAPGPPLPVPPGKAPLPTSAPSLADPLRAGQGPLKTEQKKAEEKDQDVQSPPNKVDPLGGLRMKPPL